MKGGGDGSQYLGSSDNSYYVGYFPRAKEEEVGAIQLDQSNRFFLWA